MASIETKIIDKMEMKLRELMPENEFLEFIRQITKEVFRENAEENMEDGDFKKFILENIDLITEDE